MGAQHGMDRFRHLDAVHIREAEIEDHAVEAAILMSGHRRPVKSCPGWNDPALTRSSQSPVQARASWAVPASTMTMLVPAQQRDEVRHAEWGCPRRSASDGSCPPRSAFRSLMVCPICSSAHWLTQQAACARGGAPAPARPSWARMATGMCRVVRSFLMLLQDSPAVDVSEAEVQDDGRWAVLACQGDGCATMGGDHHLEAVRAADLASKRPAEEPIRVDDQQDRVARTR
jgi:hypothetical protein